MGQYRTAQICRNGHVITDDISYGTGAKFCKDCGSETITTCQSCNAPIRGYFRVEGVLSINTRPLPVPSYCYNCGQPFPWTEERLKAAVELIDLAEIGDAEKEAMKADLPALTSDTPRTKVAATRMGQLLKKVGAGVGGALKEVLVEIGSEAAKKMLFPGS